MNYYRLRTMLLVCACFVIASLLACNLPNLAAADSPPVPEASAAQPPAAPAESAPAGHQSASLLQPGDLEYLGAFRLPDEFNWGALGLSFYPAGNGGAGTLLVTGFQQLYDSAHPGEACWDESWDCGAYYGEVTIPAPGQAANWEDLPLADLIRPMTRFDDGLAATVHREYLFVSDLEYVPRRGSQSQDKLYGSINLWYAEGVMGSDSFPTIWFANLDGSGARGMFHVGPTDDLLYHGRKMGTYLFSVPGWYAEQYLGGRTLVTGRSRGTPAFSEESLTTSGGSQGPTLFAFQPWDSDDPGGNLDALPLLYYRVKFPDCAGPNVGDPANCDFPNFSMCDEWTGGAFVESGGKRAILLLGIKGLGSNCYDEPPTVCDDPCNDSHGYHCYPYEYQVIFYDVDALGQSALGEQDPWTVLPYATWRPEEFYCRGDACQPPGGMAFDGNSGRLFMVERGLGGDTNAAVVHIWRVRP